MYRLTLKGKIQRLADGAFIPRDEGNRDYRAFLKWEAEGNVPEEPVLERAVAEKRKEIEAEVAEAERLTSEHKAFLRELLAAELSETERKKKRKEVVESYEKLDRTLERIEKIEDDINELKGKPRKKTRFGPLFKAKKGL